MGKDEQGQPVMRCAFVDPQTKTAGVTTCNVYAGPDNSRKLVMFAIIMEFQCWGAPTMMAFIRFFQIKYSLFHPGTHLLAGTGTSRYYCILVTRRGYFFIRFYE